MTYLFPPPELLDIVVIGPLGVLNGISLLEELVNEGGISALNVDEISFVNGTEISLLEIFDV
jgi:hypothetical protein